MDHGTVAGQGTLLRAPGRERLLRSLLVLGLLGASLFPLWAASRNMTARSDDTYITLTYAKSLLAGEGWRFNGGPEALGTTTPLFTLVVAGLGALLPALPLDHVAVGWSTLCWLATGWLFFLGRRAFGLAAGGAALVALVILVQGGWWLPTLGMEATFLLFGLTLTVWLTGRGHALASGLAAGLLFMIRPEGLAMVPLAALWLGWRAEGGRRRALLRFALGAFLPLGGWAIYALVEFGSLLPNSVSAKMGQAAHWPGAPFAARLLREWVPPYAARYGPTALFSLLWPLVAAGLLYVARPARPLLLLPLWTILYVGGYGLLRAPGYWWYMLPVLFALALLGTLGLLWLVGQRARWLQVAGLAIALLFVGITLQRGVRSVLQSRGDARAPTYLALADWLGENTAPRSSVAFVEIGYLGYYTDNRIVDLVGLVAPEFTAAGARLELASNFWQAEPDYLVYHPDFDWLLGPIVSDPRFAARYRVATTLAGHLATPFTIFERTPR